MAKASKKTAKKQTQGPKGKAPKKVTKGKKKATVVLSKKERLQAQKDSINARYKTQAIQSAEDFSNVFLIRRPTGIASLDLAIAGGLPAGGLTEFIGSSSVGKDYLVNRVVTGIQNVYGEDAAICFCMSEMHLDKKYAKLCGVRVTLTDTEIEEWQDSLKRSFTPEEVVWARDQVGVIHEATADNAEQLLEISAQMIASNLYQVVVINSIGALLTKAEEEADDGIEAKHYGGAAMPITNFCHRLHSAMNKKDDQGYDNLTTVIGINQYRDNLGRDAKYRPMKAAGGNAWKHAQLLSIGLRAGTKIKKAVQGTETQIGKEINWEIRKQKAGGHDGARGMYPFYYGEHGHYFGAEMYQDLIQVGVQHGVINAAGAWLSYQDDKFDLKAQGKEKFAHAIADKDAFGYLKDKIFEAADVNYIVKGLHE